MVDPSLQSLSQPGRLNTARSRESSSRRRAVDAAKCVVAADDLDYPDSQRRGELRIGSQLIDRRKDVHLIRGCRATAALLHLLIVVEHVEVYAQVTRCCVRFVVTHVDDTQQSIAVAT